MKEICVGGCIRPSKVCVEDVTCSEQVQQDGAGGREHRVGYAEMPHC